MGFCVGGGFSIPALVIHDTVADLKYRTDQVKILPSSATVYPTCIALTCAPPNLINITRISSFYVQGSR